jgi:transporter family-2 protein
MYITFITPKFGRGNAIFTILLGQIINAAVIDHYGLLGLIQKPITFIKTVGLVYMAFRV